MRKHLLVASILLVIPTFYVFAFHSVTNCDPIFRTDLKDSHYLKTSPQPNTDLQKWMRQLSEKYPKYCRATIDIQLLNDLSAGQLVTRKATDNALHFEVNYLSPAYKIAVISATGEVITQQSIEQQSAHREYYPTDKVYNFADLHQVWQKDRADFYRNLVSEVFETAFLKNMITTSDPAIIAQPPTITNEEVRASKDASNDDETTPPLPEEKLPDEVTFVQPPVTNTVNGNGNASSITNKNRNTQTTVSTNPPPRSNKKYEPLNGQLIDLLHWEFCAGHSISITNTSWYYLRLVLKDGSGNVRDTQLLPPQQTYDMTNQLTKDFTYAVLFDQECHTRQIAFLKGQINQLFKEMNLAVSAAQLTKIVGQLVPTTTTREINPVTGEVIREYNDAWKKDLLTIGPDIFMAFQQIEFERQLSFYSDLIVKSYIIHDDYQQHQPLYAAGSSVTSLQNFRAANNKKLTPNFILRGGTSGVIWNEEETVFDDVLRPEQNFHGALEIGIPFEKITGSGKQLQIARTYLSLGYNQQRYSFVPGRYFLSSDYFTFDPTVFTAERITLKTQEGMILRDESFRAGLFLKVISSRVYVNLGGGVQKRWRSKLAFTANVNYSEEPVELRENQPADFLQTNTINPYGQLRVGTIITINGSKYCASYRNGLDLFFVGDFSRSSLPTNDSYGLYPTLEGENQVSLELDRKWWFRLGLGAGIAF